MVIKTGYLSNEMWIHGIIEKVIEAIEEVIITPKEEVKAFLKVI